MVTRLTRFPPGTKEDLLDADAVNPKARDLMGPVLGAERTDAVIRKPNELERVGDVGELVRSILAVR